MGRFFKTTDAQFVDDFLFQPNMELALTALAKKDDDIKNQLSTLDFMGNLPIDYWKEADGENAKAAKAEYEQQANEIAKQMQSNLLNTGASQRAINNLRAKIEKDLEFGNLGKIQENAKAYKDFQTKLNALKDPADREAYKKMVNNYLDSTEGKGAYGSIFKPDEMYDSRNIWNEFLNSNAFKGLTPDEQAGEVVNIGGQWLTKKGNKTIQLSQTKLGQAFKGFIDSSNLAGYGGSRQKYSGEQWLDENGQIRMDANSYLGNIMANGIPSLAYNKTATSMDVTANQYGIMQAEEDARIRAEERAQRKAAIAASDKELGTDVSLKADFASKLAGGNINHVQRELNKLSKKVGIPLTVAQIPELIAYAKKTNSTSMLASLVRLQTIQKEGIRAGFSPLYEMGLSTDAVEKYKKNFQTAFEGGKANNIKGFIDFEGSGIKVQTFRKGKDGVNYATQESPSSIVNKKLQDGTIVRNATIVPGSSYPVFLSTDETFNKVQSTLELTVDNPAYAEGVKRNLNKGVEDDNDYTEGIERTIKRYVTIVQKSSDISGTGNILNDIDNNAFRANGLISQ